MLAVIGVVIVLLGGGFLAGDTVFNQAVNPAETYSFTPLLYPHRLLVTQEWMLSGRRGSHLHSEMRVTNLMDSGVTATMDNVIPKSVSRNVSRLRWHPEPRTIVRADPVVRYEVDSLAPRDQRIFAYDADVAPEGYQHGRLKALANDQAAAQNDYDLAMGPGQVPPTLAELDVEPSRLSFAIGQTYQLQVSGTMSDGSPAPLEALAGFTWRSSSSTVSVAGGNLSALRPGTATITAQAGELTRSVDATVIPRSTTGPGGASSGASPDGGDRSALPTPSNGGTAGGSSSGGGNSSPGLAPSTRSGSEGPAVRRVPVPDCTGLPAADCMAALAAGGLSGRQIAEASSSVAPGRVISTNPSAGTVLAGGSAVTVAVSSGRSYAFRGFATFGPGDVTSGPFGITTGPDGNLWFAERGANKIGMMIPAGRLTEYPLSDIGTPSMITAGPNASLWFTGVRTAGSSVVGAITTAGAVTSYPASCGGSIGGIAAGPDGNLWYAMGEVPQACRMTPSGAVTQFPINTCDCAPGTMTAGPDGNLWFTELTGKVGYVRADGSSMTEFGIPTAGGLSGQGPQYGGLGAVITSGPDGNLWFTEWGGNKIGRITPRGSVTEFSLPTLNSQPASITAGPDGNLWFTEYGANKVGRITASGAIAEFSVPTPNSRPAGITADREGNLWFTEFATGSIGEVRLQ